MALSLIPLAALPDQTVQVTLNGQNCAIRVYQKTGGLFVDVYVDNVGVIFGVRAFNLNKIVREPYLGFKGDLYFNDTQKSDEPSYSLLGTRFVLLYDSAA